MTVLTDFHSHVLPGIDDGSKSLKESIAMLRMEAEQGIRRVVATPHFYARHDQPERFLARRARSEELLRQELQKYPDLPELVVGTEVYYFSGISDSDILPELTIGGKKCILIEMPQVPWTQRMYQELADIHTNRGLTPVIAHVDRYIGPLRTYGIPEKLEELPVLVQANAEFFLNPMTRAMALRMLRGDRIHLLGSDCHNLTDRAPRMTSAVELIRRRLGQEYLDRICGYGQQVLPGQTSSLTFW